jgi:hypothetical protein
MLFSCIFLPLIYESFVLFYSNWIENNNYRFVCDIKELNLNLKKKKEIELKKKINANLNVLNINSGIENGNNLNVAIYNNYNSSILNIGNLSKLILLYF